MGYCRTLEFMSRVKSAKSPGKVVKNEVVYLRNCYPVLTSLKKAFTIYRNACKELDDNLSELCNRGFVLTSEESSYLKQRASEQVATEHRNLRPVRNIDGLIAKCERLIQKPHSHYDLILALSGLTGRRVAEIACSATFEIVSYDRVIFDGQLKTKTRGDISAYEIPVLTDSALVIQGLETLRERAGGYVDNPEKFHDACSKALSVRVKKHFEDFFPNPKAKDLRAIYGEVCYSLLDDSSITKMRYMSDILGHGASDNLTGQSYLDFYIDDIYYS